MKTSWQLDEPIPWPEYPRPADGAPILDEPEREMGLGDNVDKLARKAVPKIPGDRAQEIAGSHYPISGRARSWCRSRWSRRFPGSASRCFRSSAVVPASVRFATCGPARGCCCTSRRSITSAASG